MNRFHIALPLLLAAHVASSQEVPEIVADVTRTVKAYAEAALEEDLETFTALTPESKRSGALKTMNRLRESRALLKVMREPPFVVLASETQATFCTRIWRLGILKIDWGDPKRELMTKVSLYRARADEGEKGAGPWQVYSVSPDTSSTVPGLYSYWRNKYPDGTVYVSPDAPKWLSPPDWDAVDRIREIEERLQTVWAETREVTQVVRESCGGIDVFNRCFPEDKEGRTELTTYWRAVRGKKRERLPMTEEVALTRRGLRGPDTGQWDSWRNEYLKAIGSGYLWGKEPQPPEAVELMFDASFHPDLVGDAVYYGLSVLRSDIVMDVLPRLVDLAMQGESVGRILWGTKGHHLDMIPYLEPYLAHRDPRVAERATVLKLTLQGDADYETWLLERTAIRQREVLGEDVDRLRNALLEGDSGVRRELLTVIRRHGLCRAFDRSFTDAFKACTEDGDAEVRRLGTSFLDAQQSDDDKRTPEALNRLLRLAKDTAPEVRRIAATQLGSHFVWGSEKQNTQALDALVTLARDPDRGVRYNAVYFGLSVVNPKPETIVSCLIEIALEDRDPNMRGRITWGLRNCTAAHEHLQRQADVGDPNAAELLAEIREP